MNRLFTSIRSKFIVLLACFLIGLAALVLLHAYFNFARDQLTFRYQGSLELGNYSGEIRHLVKTMQADLYRLLYRGEEGLVNRILADNEDLLTSFEAFSVAAQKHGFEHDYYFMRENELVLLRLRADVFRAVALMQDGKESQAKQVLVRKVEPNIFHIETFVESTNRLRELELQDYDHATNALREREHLLERLLASIVFIGGLLVALYMSRSILVPIESLTRQVRNIEQDGNWKDRLAIDTDDEMRILAEAFNSLLERYANAETALASHNEILAQTVRKRTDELLETQATLIKKDRLAVLGQITGMVSHELRSPLGTISASLYTLRKRLNGDGKDAGPVLERIERNIRRCDRIVDELLSFSRSRKLNLAEVEFDAWLGDLLDEYEVPEGLVLERDPGSKAAVTFDTEYMRGAVINLLNNAVEAMTREDGFIEPGSHVRVRTRQSAGHVVLDIEDNGPGMSEEIKGQVFEPLFTTKSLGIGLGMSVVKRTVEQHGGLLDLDSVPTRGTRCTIRLNLHGG